MKIYLSKNKDRTCKKMSAIFSIEDYKEYPNTQVRKLNSEEISKYMKENIRKVNESNIEDNILSEININKRRKHV